jgi:hypothetical protein
MLLVFRKGLEYEGSMNGEPSDKEANLFPLMSLPLDKEGEDTDLNDFQWWAYSDKWDEWLKKNPRDWQAESKSVDFDKAEAILESMVTTKNHIFEYVSHQAQNIWNTGKVSSFGDYLKILEAKDESESAESFKKFIKLGFALEKLAKDNSLNDKLKIEDLEEGKEYSIVIDPMNEDGDPIQEARQAIRIKKIRESAGFILVDFDYSIPLGKVNNTESYFNKISKFAKDIAIAGAGFAGLYASVYIGGGLLSSWVLLKSSRGIYRNFSKAKKIHSSLGKKSAVRGGFEAVKKFALSAFGKKAAPGAIANAARITLPSGAFVQGGLAFSTNATGNVLLKGAAAQSVKSAASRAVAQGGARAAATVGARGAAAAGASGLLAAEASNPIGWIIAAVSVVGSGVNQVWNWLSDKQAPRYSEVKDFAYGSFKPKNIPIGKAITLCWTSDGGGGGWGFVLDLLTFGKDDTRTTMEIVKIGEMNDRSIFMVIQVNSTMFQKVMSDNDLMMLSFSNSDEFKRGYLDNDDLKFQTILIPDISELSIATSFVGYSTWEEMEKAYKDAPSNPVYVPDEAEQTYEFHYIDSKGRDVNVTGTLVNEDKLSEILTKDLVPGGDGVVSESFEGTKDFEKIMNENRVLSFADFSSVTSTLIEKDEETPGDNQENAAEEEQELKGYDKELEEVINSQTELKEQEYSRIPIIAYSVNDISFVDPSLTGSVEDFNYFIVGEQSLRPKQNQPILVESTIDNLIKEPRFGLKTYTPPTDEDIKADDESDEDVIDIEDVDKEKGKIKVNRSDVQIKSGSKSLSIRDRDIKGGISILDEFGTENLKRELNIGNWKEITSVKLRENSEGEPIKIILKNRFAKTGNRIRVLKKGEDGFNTAVKFANAVQDGITYSK